MTRKNDLLWPRALLLLWIWLSAAVVVAGRPASLWGMLPVGPAEGFWAPLAALILTVLAFGTQADLLDRLDNQTASFGLERPHTSRLLSLYVILFLLAWVFRSENHFMGDGYLVSLELVKPFHLFSTAPLNFFILQSFNRLLRALGAGSGETAYALLHCLAFPFFLWFCRRISCLLCSSVLERNALFLLTAGTGSLQLFFGYVENYTLLHLWLVVYLYFSLRFLAGNGKSRAPWGPTLAFLVAAAGHRSGVVLLPSLIYLWLQRFPASRFLKKPAGRSLATAVCSLVCLALGLLLLDNGPLVPLFDGAGGAGPYGLFSPGHLWEKLNFLLLICPALLVALPVACRRWRLLRAGDSSYFAFILWACAGTSFFLFVFNPLLGIRDWDLLCLPAVPLALAAGLALTRVLPGAGGKAFLRTLALAAAAHAATWVWINSDLSRGVRFLDRVAEADCHLDTGKFTLASMLHERGFFRKAIRQYKLVESPDRFKMQKSKFNLGNCFFNLEMPDSIIFYLSGFEKGYMVSAVVKDYDMILSLAWDMKCRSDSATSYFLAPRRLGLELDEAHRTKWAQMMTRLADSYKKKLLQDPADIDAQLFFLRLYTLKQEDDKLADVYQRLLAHYYSLEQWNRLLQFADLCGHRVYFEKILSEALAQHPEAARRPGVSP